MKKESIDKLAQIGKNVIAAKIYNRRQAVINRRILNYVHDNWMNDNSVEFQEGIRSIITAGMAMQRNIEESEIENELAK